MRQRDQFQNSLFFKKVLIEVKPGRQCPSFDIFW